MKNHIVSKELYLKAKSDIKKQIEMIKQLNALNKKIHHVAFEKNRLVAEERTKILTTEKNNWLTRLWVNLHPTEKIEGMSEAESRIWELFVEMDALQEKKRNLKEKLPIQMIDMRYLHLAYSIIAKGRSYRLVEGTVKTPLDKILLRAALSYYFESDVDIEAWEKSIMDDHLAVMEGRKP